MISDEQWKVPLSKNTLRYIQLYTNVRMYPANNVNDWTVRIRAAVSHPIFPSHNDEEKA